MPSARAVRQGVLVAFARVAATLLCWWSGFRAISDDDYARVVIAARFAQHPSPDPSGTSWLPLPFWLYGVPLALFGDSLFVARAVALVLGAASAVLVWLSARLLGSSERAAVGGALAAVLLPYGTWLAAATVPEAPTAALLLFGAATLTQSEVKLRTLGGMALGAACFSRYESWAPALVFAALCARDAIHGRKKALWLAVAGATLPIGLWLLHGVVRHGDAWFFVTRVSQYRAALGREPEGLAAALIATPWALIRFEPELFAMATVALALCFLRGAAPWGRNAWRPIAVLSTLVGFLVVADATGGSATHHAERSLLPVYWFLALLAASAVSRLAELPRAWLLPALAPPLAIAASLLLRPELRRTFVDRSEEEQVGRVLRRLGATSVALDADDYGFFAVQAALGAGKSWVMDDHDPRQQRPLRARTSEELRRQLQRAGSRWLVTTRDREALARPLGVLRLSTSRLSVLELSR